MNKIVKEKCYYARLGVAKSASGDEIKAAYRKLAIKVHPDRNPSRGAEAAFKAVQSAYTIISDPQKRQTYDTYGPEEAAEMLRQRPNFRSHSSNGQRMTPEEELFAFFMGGMQGMGGFSPPMHARRAQQQRAHPGHRGGAQFQGGAAASNPLSGMFQWLIFIVLFGMLFFGGGNSDPAFRFDSAGDFKHRRETSAEPSVFYYVRDQSAAVPDSTVHREYYSFLSQQCNQHRHQISKLQRQRTYASKADSEAIDWHLSRLKDDPNPCSRFQEYQLPYSRLYPIPYR